jgi:hypothetical protein
MEKRDWLCEDEQPLSETRLKYRRSVKGLLTRIYGDQKSRCKRNEMLLPTYTLIAFQDKFINDPDFLELYITWVRSNYETDLRPSVDRIDCFKSYSFDNIQVMTWAENRAKAADEQKKHKARRKNGK